MVQDGGSKKKQGKEGNVELYGKELVRKERKGGDNHKKRKNVFREKPWGKKMRQKVIFEESLRPKSGEQLKNVEHAKSKSSGTNKRRWAKGRNSIVEKKKQQMKMKMEMKMGNLHGKGGREKGKVWTQKKIRKNKKRGGKKGGRKRNEGENLRTGRKRIPSKFFQRLKVGSGKEVATVHTTQDGRKVKSCINFFLCLEKLLPGVDRVSGKDVHTQPQPDEEAGRGCRQRSS